MIDLSKNQTFDEPVKCLVTERGACNWCTTELLSVDHRRPGHPFSTTSGYYPKCKLTDPNKPEVKKHSHEDLIIGAIKKGWVFQNNISENIFTGWNAYLVIDTHRVAYEYNGDSTVWYNMEAKK